MEYLRVCIVAALLLALAGCAGMPMGGAQRVYSEAPRQSVRPQQADKAAPQVAYRARAGETDPKIKPYSVMGKTYWPVQSGLGFREEGFASWYGIDFHGKKTATGEVYDMFSISAAHKTLPLGTKVRVTNLENGRELELVVNVVALLWTAASSTFLRLARLLGMADNGLARVRVEGDDENPVLARAQRPPVALASPRRQCA
jgi:rare lipoprotein A